MTIAEALSIPKGMNFEEYEKLLKDKQKLEKQIAKASKDIDFEKLSTEEKVRFTALALAVKSGRITGTEFLALIEKDVSDAEAAKIQTHLKEHPDELDENKVKLIQKDMERAAAMHAVLIETGNENIVGKTPADTKAKREKFVIEAARRLPRSQKVRLNKIADAIPENASEEVATKVLTLAQETAPQTINRLNIYAQRQPYSKEFFTTFKAVFTEGITQIKKFASSFIEAFFDTAKGQAIKRYIRRKTKEIKNEKELVGEKQDDLKEKIEDAKKKEIECNKKMEEARNQELKAKTLLKTYNVKEDDLKDKDDTEKILGKISIQEKIKYSEAMKNSKKAQEKAYDANSAKRLAQALFEIVYKSLMFKIELLRTKVAAIMNLC